MMNKLILIISVAIFSCQFAQSQNIVVLPERFKESRVLIVNSAEFRKAVSDNANLRQQLDEEIAIRQKFSVEVDKQVVKNNEVQNEMVQKITKLNETILKKDKTIIGQELSILWHRVVIAGLTLSIEAYFFAKFYFRLPI